MLASGSFQMKTKLHTLDSDAIMKVFSVIDRSTSSGKQYSFFQLSSFAYTVVEIKDTPYTPLVYLDIITYQWFYIDAGLTNLF